jgi:tetratricopeptide (TPR) repeat protein
MGQFDASQGGRICLVEDVDDVQHLNVRDPSRVGVVTQTTLSVDDTADVLEALQARFPTLATPRKEDICYATQNRQDAVKFMAPQCDLVLVVGSPSSSNSNRLREVAEKMGCEARLIGSAAELDPAWRTVYFYGGGMLRVCGDIDGSDELYKRGFEALPDDAFFPFSVGMNAYLYRDDREAAFTRLEQAASLPGAPAWYGAAASAFLAEEGERQAALAYLNQQLKEETRPAARETLQKRMMRLMHEELAEQLNRRRVEIEAQTGAPLVSLDALGPLPDDPYGQGWVLAPDGEVRSAAREEIEARRARKNERALILRVTASP